MEVSMDKASVLGGKLEQLGRLVIILAILITIGGSFLSFVEWLSFVDAAKLGPKNSFHAFVQMTVKVVGWLLTGLAGFIAGRVVSGLGVGLQVLYVNASSVRYLAAVQGDLAAKRELAQR
jgi:hypothetical protein